MRLAWLVLVGCGGTATGGEGGPQQVYVHFDGITLQQGAEDATTNTSGAFGGILTRYRDTAGDRDARIASTLAAMSAIVEPFRLDIVDVRPELGRYDMIVIAGTPEEAGMPAGGAGVAAVDCENAIPNKIVVLFGNAFADAFTPDMTASLAIAGLASSQGIPSANLADDCTCWTGIDCRATKRCTFGGAGTPIAGGDPCADGETTMDPTAEFAAIYPLEQ